VYVKVIDRLEAIFYTNMRVARSLCLNNLVCFDQCFASCLLGQKPLKFYQFWHYLESLTHCIDDEKLYVYGVNPRRILPRQILVHRITMLTEKLQILRIFKYLQLPHILQSRENKIWVGECIYEVKRS